MIQTKRLLLKKKLNAKISEIKNKIPSISGLATNSAFTAFENKMPDDSNLVQKTDYDTKINEIEYKVSDHNHDKYITTPEFNNLAAGVFTERLAQAYLKTKTDFDTKLKSLNQKVNSNKTKHLFVENGLKRYKHLIQVILEVKVILMKIVLKLI